MAGLTVFLGLRNRPRVEAAAARLRFFEETVEIISDDGFSAAWVGHDDPALFGPAVDPLTGVRVITSGRIAWDELEWQRAERLKQFEGGLSNRLLLDLFLAKGPSALSGHHGTAALVLWDARARVAHLWTDHFGYHPVFLYRSDQIGQLVISTSADAIADDPECVASLDPVATAEFLSAWRITPPHTYYREITHAGAATHHRWDLSGGSHVSREYWRPHHTEPFARIDEAAEELASAVSNAVRIRTLDRLGPTAAFVSGGMDSRVVLFAAASRSGVSGVNLYDVPNRESAISRRLCETAGVRYVGFGRDDDYYPRSIRDGVRLSGGMWSQEDNHYLGTRNLLKSLGARTVITACTTDWLFKGYGLEKTYARFVGRNLPIKVFTRQRVDGFLPNYPRPVPPSLSAEVGRRLETWFSGTPRSLREDRDWLLVEDRRIRPACYAVSVSGPIMYRIFPYDTFLADNHVAACYGRIKAAWKLNADVWARAVRRICKGADDIEDANFGWRVGSSTVRKLGAFASGWIRRRVRPSPLGSSGLATEGSWPNLGWYLLHSVTLRDVWQSTPADIRDAVATAWGSDPWSRPLAEWSAETSDFFRLMTLAVYLQRDRRPSSATAAKNEDASVGASLS